MSRFLRLLFPHLHVIGVDTHGSVLFGLPDEGNRLLRGLGNSMMPKNLDHRVFDEVHWVSGQEGFLATRQLHRSHAIFAGPTSGAAFQVARWWNQQNPGATVVALFPDEGYRYQDSVYNDEWLAARGLQLESIPSDPRVCSHPDEVSGSWTQIPWNLRTYEQVIERVPPLGPR
jgi:threonine synthase